MANARAFASRCRLTATRRKRRLAPPGQARRLAWVECFGRRLPVSNILVVDDEQAVCWALERALTRDGHRVSVAASAEEAFEVAGKKKPDAIVLDVRLPGMD